MVSSYLTASLFAVVTLYSVRKCIEIFYWRKCPNNVSLKNKIIIVTGADSGIGYETTKEFAKRGAVVILACRNLKKANLAAKRIHKELGFVAKLYPLKLDLSSMKSVGQFVDEFDKNFSKVHILVNNAGVNYPPNEAARTNEKGIEIHFAINYLGHFNLTYLLVKKKILVWDINEPSRIVNVTSKLFESGELDFDNWLEITPFTKNGKFYQDSKLAQVYFSDMICKVFHNIGVNSYAVCPGFTYTNLFRHYKFSAKMIFALPLFFFILRSPKMGAQTSIYCATQPSLNSETCLIYRNCKQYKSHVKIDPKLSAYLWNYTLHILTRYLTF